MGVTPPNGPSKIQTFYLLSSAHEIFKERKHKGKLKFDIIWGTKMGGPQNGATKIVTF